MTWFYSLVYGAWLYVGVGPGLGRESHFRTQTLLVWGAASLEHSITSGRNHHVLFHSAWLWRDLQTWLGFFMLASGLKATGTWGDTCLPSPPFPWLPFLPQPPKPTLIRALFVPHGTLSSNFFFPWPAPSCGPCSCSLCSRYPPSQCSYLVHLPRIGAASYEMWEHVHTNKTFLWRHTKPLIICRCESLFQFALLPFKERIPSIPLLVVLPTPHYLHHRVTASVFFEVNEKYRVKRTHNKCQNVRCDIKNKILFHIIIGWYVLWSRIKVNSDIYTVKHGCVEQKGNLNTIQLVVHVVSKMEMKLNPNRALYQFGFVSQFENFISFIDCYYSTLLFLFALTLLTSSLNSHAHNFWTIF